MVEVRDLTFDAAWKIANLGDFSERLERAAERVESLVGAREAAVVIYESVLMKSGRPRDEVRAQVEEFRAAYYDDDDPLTIPRTSGLMNVEGERWFFGDDSLRTLTGQLLGQFQHRVAQYNYIPESEVLKRWADSYDTRLFIRRRIYDTEPVVGVVAGFDLALLQYLRVTAGGDTLVPSEGVAKVLVSLGFDETTDPYDILTRAEGIALRLELPAPLLGEMLEELAREDFSDFPEPPAKEAEDPAESDESGGDVAGDEGDGSSEA